jgi:hypothetical protein
MHSPVFNLKPSKPYTILLVMVFVASLLMIAMLPIGIFFKCGLLAVTVAYGVRLRRHDAILALQREPDGKWRLSTAGLMHRAVLLGDSIVMPWLSVLRFKVPGKRRPLSCVITGDSLGPEQYQRLRVWVRMGS